MENNLQVQCINYFKMNKGFKRVLIKIKEKYESLGTLGGNIVLTSLTQEEKETLTGFMKKDYFHQKSAAISVSKFMKALENTKFESVEFLEVLEGYFGEKLIPKKEQRKNIEEEKADFFNRILENFDGTLSKRWLMKALEDKGPLYKILTQRYDIDKTNLRNDIIHTCTALNNLPAQSNLKERLAVFASKFTQNPHGLDENMTAHTLFIYGLAHIYNQTMPKNAEEKTELLYEAGIVKDDLSNYTLCSGLLGYTKEGAHKGWEAFYTEQEPLLISLWNLMKIDKVVSPGGRVFVVENPTVFSEILDKTRALEVPLICTYGQIKLASFMLLDLLVKEGTVIYYSGDFDPEGLLIAEKLKQRYKDQLILWGYNKDNYLNSLSKQELSQSRLKKLRNLKDKTLLRVGELIKEKGLAGYQEMFIDQLIEEINNYD